MRIIQIAMFFLVIGCSNPNHVNTTEKFFSNMAFRNSKPILHGNVSEKTKVYYKARYVDSELKNISRYGIKEGGKLLDIEINKEGKFFRQKVYKYIDGDLFNLVYIKIRNPQWVYKINFGASKSDFGHGDQCVVNCL